MSNRVEAEAERRLPLVTGFGCFFPTPLSAGAADDDVDGGREAINCRSKSFVPGNHVHITQYQIILPYLYSVIIPLSRARAIR